MTRLRWLSTGPTEASAAAVKTEVGKLEFLRGLDAHTLDLSRLPAERRRHLAAVGRRSSLTHREPHRRYPIVVRNVYELRRSAIDRDANLDLVSSRHAKHANGLGSA